MKLNSRKKGLLFLLPILGMFIILLTPGVGLAQGERWSRAVVVSGFLAGSRYPSLAVGGNDNVSIVWSAGEDPKDSLLYYSHWDGEAWTKPIDVRYGSDHSALALDRFGDLNLLFIGSGRATFATSHLGQASSTQGWKGDTSLSVATGTTAFQMAVEDDGVIHVVRTQSSTECGNCASVLYQQSTDAGQTWSDPLTLSIQPADRRRVQLKIDSRGTLHVVWDGIGPKVGNQSIRYTYSTDHGKTWAPPQQFFGPAGTPVQAAVGVAANNQVVIVWQTSDHNEIYYQVSNDGGISWGQPAVLPGIKAGKPSDGFDEYQMVADSAGVLHLAAVGQGVNTDLPWVYHLEWDGKNWSKPDVVYGGPDFPEYPRLAVSDGNRLHLTWFTRGPDSISGPPDDTYQVWYSSMLTSAPEATPLPTFTPAPYLSPTAAPQTVTPSPTPLPSFPNSEQTRSADTSPLQQQLSVLVGVIPAIFIIGLVVVIRLRSRRRF